MSGREEQGFTLIELLVVVAVISILAAIAIPAYGSYKAQGIDAQMKSTLRNARTATESFYLQNGSSYSGLDVDALEDNGYRPTSGVTLSVVDAQESSYQLRACAAGGSSPAFFVDSNGSTAISDSGTCS